MTAAFPHRHLLGIEGLSPADVLAVLDRAEAHAAAPRDPGLKSRLRGRTLINLFFENSTRTQASFELAGKRLGADVMNLSVRTSSVAKGETLLDTAATLNAMAPDLIVIRHERSGAPALLAQKVDAAVINAGDGRHEHPTQALLDALAVRERKGRLHRLVVAICGDVAHSRVARSNMILWGLMESRVRVCAPPTLLPPEVARYGVEVCHDMDQALEGADVVMMLRLQQERMEGALMPSQREYFNRYGLDHRRLARAKPDAIVLHPGPMNRGVEIDSLVADDPARSVIPRQVELGVAVRMAVLELLAEGRA